MLHNAATLDGGGEGLDHFGNGIHGIPTHDTAAPISRTSCRLRLRDLSGLRISRSPNRKTSWDICSWRSSKDARPKHLFPVSTRTLFHCQGADYSNFTAGVGKKIRKKKLEFLFQKREADAPVDGVERGVYNRFPGVLADQSASCQKLLAFGGTQGADQNHNRFAACQREFGL